MYKVLIVDDELIVRHAVKTLIRWENSRFEYAGSAASGYSALEMVGKTGADIVITDIKMPEMDGIALIKQLTAEGFDGEVLVLSNYNDYDLVREALKCGAHDYMLKLTLKTESFMQTLEEMAGKLDSRRAEDIPDPKLATRTDSSMDRIRDMLRKIDAAPSESLSWKLAEEGGLPLLEAGERVYSFILLLQDNEQAQSGSLHETLDTFTESMFLGSRWAYALRTDPRRYLLVAAYTPTLNSAEPEELAHRAISLASMYYNVNGSIIYAATATSVSELAMEMSRSRKVEILLFYSRQLRERCLSNRMTVADDGDEVFRLAEAKLRDSMRRPNSGTIDLWTESALYLVQIAAERSIHPRVLKRALSGGIWSVAHAEELGIRYAWDEKPWLKQVESANSDLHLMDTIRELAEEVADSEERYPVLPAVREEVRQAILYLEEHYPNRISIADIAAHVGFSEPYLCQVFKADTGSSILTSLNEIRMIKAHEMLASGKYLVKQAAIEVGIPDPFYFNRLFKKRYGIAPKNVKQTSRA